MNNPIPVAIVGLGRAGWSIHAEQLRQRADFKIVDVVDPEPKRREEAATAFNCGTHATVEDLLKASSAEIVVVATPSHLHEGDSLKVLNSGRHCVVEKPMATSLPGARRMIATAKRKRRMLFVHQNYRFNDEFRCLREVIDSGIIGRIFEVRACWLGFGRRNDWQTLQKNGGGVLNNTCPHTIDMALNLLDAPITALLGDLQHIKDAGDCEDHVHIFMRAKNGQTADLTVSTTCALPSPKWMLLGSCGTASCDDSALTLRYYDPKLVAPLKVVEGPAPERRYGNNDVLPWKDETRPLKPVGKHGNFYDNVAEVLRHRGKMMVTPESAAEIIRIIAWARKGTKLPKPGSSS